MPIVRRNEPISVWEEGDFVQGFALLSRKESRYDKNGREYLDIELCDESGSLGARVWPDNPAVKGDFREKDFIFFKGTVRRYRDQLQHRLLPPSQRGGSRQRPGRIEVGAVDAAGPRRSLAPTGGDLSRCLAAPGAAPAGGGGPAPFRPAAARTSRRQADPSRLSRRSARARGGDGGVGDQRRGALSRARSRPAAARGLRPRQAPRAEGDAGQRLHRRGAAGRQHRDRHSAARRVRGRGRRLSPRAAAPPPAPNPLPPRPAGLRQPGGPRHRRGLRAPLHRRSRLEAQPAAQPPAQRRRGDAVHPGAVALGLLRSSAGS